MAGPIKCPQCLTIKLESLSAPNLGAHHANYRCKDCECEFTYLFADKSYRIYKSPSMEGLEKVRKLVHRSFVDGDDFFYTYAKEDE